MFRWAVMHCFAATAGGTRRATQRHGGGRDRQTKADRSRRDDDTPALVFLSLFSSLASSSSPRVSLLTAQVSVNVIFCSTVLYDCIILYHINVDMSIIIIVL